MRSLLCVYEIGSSSSKHSSNEGRLALTNKDNHLVFVIANTESSSNAMEKLPSLSRGQLLINFCSFQPLCRRVCQLSLLRVLAPSFLSRSGKLFFSFFGLKQYVVRIAQVLFPALSRFSVPAPIIKLDLVGYVWIAVLDLHVVRKCSPSG